MTTPFKDYNQSFTGSGTESLSLSAGSGIGKSSFCRDLCTHLLNKGERVGYLALEESNRRTASDLCPQQSDEASTLESMIDLS